LSAGQLKLATHVMRLCQMRDGLNSDEEITSQTLVSMLNLLEGRTAFNNVFLRHYLFCILQILARRYMFLIQMKCMLAYFLANVLCEYCMYVIKQKRIFNSSIFHLAFKNNLFGTELFYWS